MGVGERRGGRHRAGGHRRAGHHHHPHHHPNHHHHVHHHNHAGGRHAFGGIRLGLFAGRRRRAHHTGNTGHAAGTTTIGTAATSSSTQGQPTCSGIYVLCCFFGFGGFMMGMIMANLGGWTNSSLGIVGMVFLILGPIAGIFTCCFYHRLAMKNNAALQGDVESVTVTGDATLSTATGQPGALTTHVVSTNPIQPGGGGVAMGTSGITTFTTYPYGMPNAPGQPGPPISTISGAPYPPPQPGMTPYPVPPPGIQAYPVPPPVIQAYPVSFLAASTAYPDTTATPMGESGEPPHVGGSALTSASEPNEAPPPAYDDVIAGKVIYNVGEGDGNETEPTASDNPESQNL